MNEESLRSDKTPRIVPAGEGESSFTKSLLAWLRSLSGGPSVVARDPLAALIEVDRLPATIDPEERLMLMNILKLDELTVGEVMVPRADIIALEAPATLDEAMALVRREMHTRIPIYRGSLDHIMGMVHVKDLILQVYAREFDLAKIMRTTLFVPPSMSVRDLLTKMRASRIHLAIVVDEYGGTDGLATIEDLVEEIVGEIHDEHDEADAPLLVNVSSEIVEADARLPIAELQQHFGLPLVDEARSEGFDTVGGLIFALVGRIPRIGERVLHPTGLEFEVTDADSRRIKRLRVHLTKGAAAPGA